MKRSIATIVLCMICLPLCVGHAQDEISQVFTVSDAMGYAVEHSLSVEQAEADLIQCRYKANIARKNYNDFVSSGTSFEEALSESGYTYKAAQIALNQVERTLIDKKNTVKKEVEKTFYTCLNQQKKIDAAMENLENTKVKYEQAKTQYDNGLIAQLDLKSFELAVTNAQNSYNQALRAKDLSMRELKNKMNIENSTDIKLVGEFNPQPVEIQDIDTAIELAKTQNLFLSVEEAKELVELRYKIADGWYASNELSFAVEEESYKSQMAEYYDTIKTLEYNIASSYYSILSLRENISYLEEYAALMNDNAQAAYLQYQLGMLTSSEYIEAQQQYFNAYNDLLDTQLSCYVAEKEYLSLYTGNPDVQ